MVRFRTKALALLFPLSGAIAACFLLPGVGELTGGSSGGDAALADAAREASDGASTCDATFCDDFDRGALGATWTEVRGLDAGFMSLGAPAVSPPNALQIVQFDGGGAQKNLPMLVKDLPKGSSLRCSFSVLGDQLPPANGSGDVLVFLFAGGASFVDNEILLALDKAGIGLREDVRLLDGGCACPNFDVGPFPIPTGLFTRITMATDFSIARIFVNDTEVATHAVTGAGASQVRVFFGYDRPAGTSRIRFDDFSCTVTP